MLVESDMLPGGAGVASELVLVFVEFIYAAFFIVLLDRCTFCRDQVGLPKMSLKNKRYLILRKIVTC